jgi:hypothetical protein
MGLSSFQHVCIAAQSWHALSHLCELYGRAAESPNDEWPFPSRLTAIRNHNDTLLWLHGNRERELSGTLETGVMQHVLACRCPDPAMVARRLLQYQEANPHFPTRFGHVPTIPNKRVLLTDTEQHLPFLARGDFELWVATPCRVGPPVDLDGPTSRAPMPACEAW